MTELLWTEPSWRAEVDAWIGAQLGRLGLDVAGPVEQPHVRPWSTVLRVPTTDGDLYFKAEAPVQAFEVRLLGVLMEDFADRVPPVLAADPDRAWMLMRDGGTPFRDLVQTMHDLHHWHAVVPLFAELQRDVAKRVDELLELGVRDLRLERLPGEFASLVERVAVTDDEREALRALETRVVALCEELLDDGIGASLQHNDLHANNVLFDGTRYRIFDWGDSSISHPFQTMYITLAFLKLDHGLADGEPALARIRDAYLEPWSGLLPRNELLRSFRLAEKLAAVSDVLTEERVVTANRLEPSPDDRRAPARMLRGLLDVL